MKSNSPTIEEELLHEISSLIERRFIGALRISNYVAIELYWKIGDAINQSLNLNPELGGRNIISNISDILVSVAGELLNSDNLHKMQQFAGKFSETVFRQTASYISWPHIQEMLSLDSADQIIFYARMAVEHNLTPQELNKKIVSRTYETSLPVKLKFSDRPLFDFENTKYAQRVIPLMDYLLHPLSEGFKPLLEPTNKLYINATFDIAMGFEQQSLINSIVGFINGFQKYLNPWLNGMYSMLHHEISIILNENPKLSSLDQSVKLKLLKEIGQRLEKNYGKGFDHLQLLICLELLKQYEDTFDFMKVVALVRWEYVTLLSHVSSIEEKLFYAKMVASKDWEPAHLKKQIQGQFYQRTQKIKNFKELQVQQKPHDQDYGQKEIFVDIRSRDVDDVKNSKSVRNIYENNSFLMFIKKCGVLEAV